MYVTEIYPNEKINVDIALLFNTGEEAERFTNIMHKDLPDVRWSNPEEIPKRDFVLDSLQKTEMAFDVEQRTKETIKWLKEKYLGKC